MASKLGLPYPQVIFRKHDFGTNRYVTLMVTKLPKWVKDSLFGTELQPQIDFPCDTIADGTMIADVKFKQRFPEHVRDESGIDWRPFPLNEGPVKMVQ